MQLERCLILHRYGIGIRQSHAPSRTGRMPSPAGVVSTLCFICTSKLTVCHGVQGSVSRAILACALVVADSQCMEAGGGRVVRLDRGRYSSGGQEPVLAFEDGTLLCALGAELKKKACVKSVGAMAVLRECRMEFV